MYGAVPAKPPTSRLEPRVRCVDESADEIRVVVEGQLDLSHAPAFSAAARTAVKDGRPHVVLDLSGCTFIDSTGLGVVLDLHARVGAAGNRLTILPGGPTVERVFAVTGLRDILPFAKTEG